MRRFHQRFTSSLALTRKDPKNTNDSDDFNVFLSLWDLRE